MGDLFDPYPASPGFKEDETSRQAARVMAAAAEVMRVVVLDAITKAGEDGLTADETATRLRLSPFSVRPRVSELRRTGKIEKTGIRRPNASGLNAHVWKAVKEGA